MADGGSTLPGVQLDVRPYPVSVEDVRKAMEFLRGSHRVYYTIYRVMIESGARYAHVLRMIESWRPGETVEIPGVGIATERLVCLDGGGFCRYYMGFRGSAKQFEWIYFSRETLDLLRQVAPRKVSRHQPRRCAERHGLVLPKYLRKLAWRLMVKTMGREVARFIQSRFGELGVSEARYEDLLGEADQAYPKYLKHLAEVGLT